MATLDDAKFVEEQDIFGGFVRLTDIGSRDIVTLEKDQRFLSVFSYEGYAHEELEIYEGSLNSKETHLVINYQGKIVFHARRFFEREDVKKPENPLIEENVAHGYGGGYELLKLKKGGWISQLQKVDRVICEDIEEEYGMIRHRSREEVNEIFPQKPLNFANLLSTLGVN